MYSGTATGLRPALFKKMKKLSVFHFCEEETKNEHKSEDLMHCPFLCELQLLAVTTHARTHARMHAHTIQMHTHDTNILCVCVLEMIRKMLNVVCLCN